MASMYGPTIKGIFVRQHIKAVKKSKGQEGLQRLEKLFGKSIIIKNSQDVLISDEVSLLECALKVLYPKAYSQKELEFESGKLHFRSFVDTPIARIVLLSFRKNFNKLIANSDRIAHHILHGVAFTVTSLGTKKYKVCLSSNSYPLEHFKGFFTEWMAYTKIKGTVSARHIEPGMNEYILEWH